MTGVIEQPTLKYSIIIPTLNHLDDLLKPCLSSILQYTDISDDMEVVVVANGCTDGTKEYVESLGKQFKLLWFDGPLGYTKAINEGIKASSGESLILLNNDTVLLSQAKNTWINMLLDPLKGDVGITGPMKSRMDYIDHDAIIFFCAAIQRKLFNELGLLDEIYSPGAGEDVDFCIQAERAGYRILQVPDGEQLKDDPKFMVGSFPIYHAAESTMLDEEHAEEWYKIIERNRKLLTERFALPEGMFWEHDIKAYRSIMNEVPIGGTICELGPWKGRSLCSVADIIIKRKLNVIAVDIFTGTAHEEDLVRQGKESDIEAIFRSNMKRFGLDPVVHRMTTNEASKLIEDGSLDLCFIDADHSFKGITEDLFYWIPKVKKGGLIGGHDYNGMAWPDVRKVVDTMWREVRYEYPSLVWSKQL